MLEVGLIANVFDITFLVYSMWRLSNGFPWAKTSTESRRAFMVFSTNQDFFPYLVWWVPIDCLGIYLQIILWQHLNGYVNTCCILMRAYNLFVPIIWFGRNAGGVISKYAFTYMLINHAFKINKHYKHP